MLPVAVISVVAVVALCAVAMRLRRVLGAVPFDVRALARWARVRDADALRALAINADGSTVGELLRALAAPGPTTAAIAFANETLHELAGELGWGRAMGASLVRGCALATLFAAAASLIGAGGITMRLVDVVVLGVGACVTAATASRAAAQVEQVGREGLDALVDAALVARGRRECGISRSDRIG